MPGDELLRTAAVAEMLAVSANTVKAWRLLGRGPHWFRLGRVVVYRRSVVEAWIAEQERRGAA